jgi:plasmid stabilization system protein ParE
VMGRIVASLGLLSRMPGAGHFRPDLTDEPVKFWQIFSYLIVFDHSVQPIRFARVLHTSGNLCNTDSF